MRLVNVLLARKRGGRRGEEMQLGGEESTTCMANASTRMPRLKV
jgi:hypothetical protein